MISKELTGASTIPIILSILVEKEDYGYQIIKKVKTVSNGSVKWSEPMLYPVLHRLERDDCIKSKWRELPNGRNRKYYSITLKGKKLLESKKSEWKEMMYFLSKMWNLKPNQI